MHFSFCSIFTGDKKIKVLDDDSDRGSEASSGSRSKKGNSTKSGKSKSNRKKLDDGVDGDSDTSQASGKNNKKKTKNTPKMKREKVIISKKRKERKKSAGEISFIICSLTYDISVVFVCFQTILTSWFLSYRK